jgi:hypothetical protein
MDHFAKKKSSDTIPRTRRITFPTLITEFIGLSTCLFDAIDDHFEGGEGYRLHTLL